MEEISRIGDKGTAVQIPLIAEDEFGGQLAQRKVNGDGSSTRRFDAGLHATAPVP